VHRLRALRQQYHQLTDEQRAYTWTYGWGILWALVYVALTPAQTLAVFLQPVIILWCVVQVVAGAAAIRGTWTGDHLVLERTSLAVLRWVSLAYPLTTVVVLIGDLLATGTSSRWHLLVLGTWPFVFLAKRARYLQRKADEARATPLPDEQEA